jgi:hypothetical protein
MVLNIIRDAIFVDISHYRLHTCCPDICIKMNPFQSYNFVISIVLKCLMLFKLQNVIIISVKVFENMVLIRESMCDVN